MISLYGDIRLRSYIYTTLTSCVITGMLCNVLHNMCLWWTRRYMICGFNAAVRPDGYHEAVYEGTHTHTQNLPP